MKSAPHQQESLRSITPFHTYAAPEDHKAGTPVAPEDLVEKLTKQHNLVTHDDVTAQTVAAPAVVERRSGLERRQTSDVDAIIKQAVGRVFKRPPQQ